MYSMLLNAYSKGLQQMAIANGDRLKESITVDQI